MWKNKLLKWSMWKMWRYYFLNNGDKHCSKTENCTYSSFGICEYCNDGYYLSKKEELCLKKKNIYYVKKH